MQIAIASTARTGISSLASLLARLPRGFSMGIGAEMFNSKSGDIGLLVFASLLITFMADLV